MQCSPFQIRYGEAPSIWEYSFRAARALAINVKQIRILLLL